MHELAVAERLVGRAAGAARDAGAAEVTALTVELGTATHLVADQVGFCVEVVAEGTPVEGATVRFDRVDARGACDCGWTGVLDSLAETVAGVPDRRCPDCGAAVDLVAGRECRVASIEVPDEETDRRGETP
ncbi:MAG: hydrogenase maturation nickel metallochaperone HypA [Haloferacaceae archaeon]